MCKKNLKVLVVEKSEICLGASVRNFGLFWAIGQEEEFNEEVVLSKQVFEGFFKDAGIWHKHSGSLGLTYHPDDFNLINEFVALHSQKNYSVLNAAQVSQKYPYINTTKLQGALFSPNEITV